MPAEVHPGDVLADKFRVVRVLGEGGMGIVYEAEHLSLGERVAVKLLHGERETGAVSQRLLREARAAARIKSEHVARVYDFGMLHDGTPFLVMELVEGPSVARVIRDEGPLAVERAVRFALEICLALAEAHALGIVHRDVKPSNLIVATRRDGSEVLKVLDFGVAKQLGAEASALTASSGMLGSPSYMSPEQIRDAHSVDERTDIWSLGVVLYEMLTARLPFEAFTAPGVLAAITADDPTPPTRHRSDLDSELVTVISRCFEKQREARYPRVVELASALAARLPSGEQIVGRVRRLRESSHERAYSADPLPVEPADETSLTQNATATTAAESSGPAEARPPRSRRWLAIGAVGLVSVVLSVVAFTRPSAAPSIATTVSVAQPPLPAARSVASDSVAHAPLAWRAPVPARSAEVKPSVTASPLRRTKPRAPLVTARPSEASAAPPASSAPKGEPLDFGYRK